MLADPKTALANRLLLLWLIDDASKKGSIGITKTHKLTFLSQYEMMKQEEKGFSYNFIKWSKGPVSKELKEDVTWLNKRKLIDITRYKVKSHTPDGQNFSCTEMGLKILTDFHEMFNRNSRFVDKILVVNNNYAFYPAHELVDIVHSQPNPCNPDVTIHDTVSNALILPYYFGAAKQEFVITPEEEATLEIYLDAESYESAIEACNSARTSPLLSLDEVF